MAAPHYVIRGGMEGRERLRILSRVMRPSTLEFLSRNGIRPGDRCLDAGCGGGDVTQELARLVGPQGRVTGIDLDEAKLAIARAESAAAGLSNIEYRAAGIGEAMGSGFDHVYCRFVLTHLSQPLEALRALHAAVVPGGRVMVCDIDFAGYFWYPESWAQQRFSELYVECVGRKGGDAYIGPRLPGMFAQAGFEDIQLNLVQPLGTSGEVKPLAPVTMEMIADAVVASGLASPEEVRRVVDGLYAFAEDTGTLASVPRMFEVSGRRPAA